MELKSEALQSAIWRLTAGKGERGLKGPGLLHKSGSAGSGDFSGAEKAGEPTSERKTAAGRLDFVLQVRDSECQIVLYCMGVVANTGYALWPSLVCSSVDLFKCQCTCRLTPRLSAEAASLVAAL